MAAAYSTADWPSAGGSFERFRTAAVAQPAIFVPLPFAAANHQEYNARALANAGPPKYCFKKT
jgi:UDP-N-acetylglucosamine:LPS N-acetylglucosamine transferase